MIKETVEHGPTLQAEPATGRLYPCAAQPNAGFNV